jgi:CDP-paratose 2-epimerase
VATAHNEAPGAGGNAGGPEMTYLVTGGCGFIGSNITGRLLRDGKDVVVFDNMSRNGSFENLAWLRKSGLAPEKFIHGDIRNQNDVDALIEAVKPEAIFHLSGQVAMTTSMRAPRRDFEINVLGSINLLESVRRHASSAAIIYSSSNKVYGDLGAVALQELEKRYVAADFPCGISEMAHLDFHTPYGCSKGAADQYMLDYARTFGLRTVVFRHSTVYGGRQYATCDQGWVGWFCQQALAQKTDPVTTPFTISGDGKQVRDLLFVDDAVEAYLAAVSNLDRARGHGFNIGGGMENSSSLLELFDTLQDIFQIRLAYRPIEWRAGDQKFFVADIGKAAGLLNWKPRVGKEAGIRAMCNWVESL